MKCFGLSAEEIPAHIFWKHVIVRDGCWGWRAFKDRRGYGRVNIRTSEWHRSVTAHRISWALHNGAIPADKNVLHHCDNPECSNPEHLYLGTHAQNMRDMKERGRATGRGKPGEASGHAKLSEEDVLKIRATTGKSHADMAAEFGVSRATVTLILQRKTWRHI